MTECPQEQAGREAVLLDSARREVEFQGHRMLLASRRSWKLLQALCDHPGRFFDRTDLWVAAWENYPAEPTTVRKAIARLRAELVAGGLEDLARRIDTKTVRGLVRLRVDVDVAPSKMQDATGMSQSAGTARK